jgi:hypothetical protein
MRRHSNSAEVLCQKRTDTVGELQAFRFQEVKRESDDTLAQDSAVSAALSMPLGFQEDVPHMPQERPRLFSLGRHLPRGEV